MAGINDGQKVDAANSNAAWIAKNANDSTVGILTVNNVTQSTTKDNGALIVEGGVGIEKNLNVGGSVVVTGDLTVNGTTTSVQTANTLIKDALVTFNDGGNDASSEDSGFEIERTTTNAAMQFQNSLASKFKIGLLGSMLEVLVSGVAQTISGIKTFSAQLLVSDTTQSTTKDTGSIVTEGGIGVEKNINAGGSITVVGAVTGSNLSGTNTGDVTLGSIGATPTAAGASLSGQVLTLQPASATLGGVLTAIAQSILGIKTFLSALVVSDTTQTGSLGVGSIVTQGGISAAKNIYVGGAFDVVGLTNLTGHVTLQDAGSFKEQASPTNPSATYRKLYPKSDGKWYSLSSAGAETDLSGTGVQTTKGDIAGFSTLAARVPVGTNDQMLVVDSVQALGLAYNHVTEADLIANLSIAASVAANALTIALKTAAGADASATDPIKVAFRSATLTSGVVSLVKTTAALSIVVPSTATLGHVSSTSTPIYVYELNNAGSGELALSTSYFDETALVSTTAISAAATSATVMYSTTARSNVAFRCIGRLLSTQTTAGTWAAVPTSIAVGDNSKAPYVGLTLLTATSGIKTPSGSDQYHQSTTNSVTLTVGTWQVDQSALFSNGGAVGYIAKALGIFGANGNDTATVPTLLSATANLTVNSAYSSTIYQERRADIGDLAIIHGPSLIITVTASVTIFIVTFSSQSTSANARITGYLTARKLY